jgi:4,5-DOPA dioxygenase extradiol
MTDLMPAIFFGHGNPMNALSKNAYTDGWASIGNSLPRPEAVLSVSAHWYLPACAVTANLAPPTIHDFGGFPRELYQVEYRAPGSPELARRVQDLLAPVSVELDDSWGLDHGTWAVLRHVFPEADIPIVQLSIDERQPAEFHYELGKRLAALRAEGVLIIGSGNIVHNLHAYAWGTQEVEAGAGAADQRRRCTADRLREIGARRAVVDSDTGTLPAITLCDGRPQEG